MDSRRMCPHCRAFITTKDRVCPYCNETVGARAVDLRNAGDLLGGFIPHARFNTMLILLINFGMYLVTVLYSLKAGNNNAFWRLDGRTLVVFGASFGPGMAAGQWWRLVTAGFLHGGLFHILMNSWVLFDLGAQVEEVYGAARMWVIYFLSTVGGFYLSVHWHPMSPSVGASAALYGMIGAMIALGVGHRSSAGQAIGGLYIRWAIYGLIISFIPGIDLAAHLGGLAVGFGAAYLAGQPRLQGSPTETLWTVASWLCVLLTASSFLLMYLWFRQYAQ